MTYSGMHGSFVGH